MTKFSFRQLLCSTKPTAPMMPRIPIVAGLVLATAQPQAALMAAASPVPIVISAATSLTKPLNFLALNFSKSNKSTVLRFNFGSSGTLKQQIEKGAPVDVFLSAGEKQMNQLERLGLIMGGTRRLIAGNQLVLVVPSSSSRRMLNFKDLANSNIHRLAIGDSTVPAGDYARQALAYYKLTDVVKTKLVPMGSAQAVANAVASGNVDAGIIYQSDAQNVPNLRITAAASKRSHTPIIYSAAVIRSTKHPQQAKAYVKSLTTPQASTVLRRYGLLAPSAMASTKAPAMNP